MGHRRRGLGAPEMPPGEPTGPTTGGWAEDLEEPSAQSPGPGRRGLPTDLWGLPVGQSAFRGRDVVSLQM